VGRIASAEPLEQRQQSIVPKLNDNARGHFAPQISPTAGTLVMSYTSLYGTWIYRSPMNAVFEERSCLDVNLDSRHHYRKKNLMRQEILRAESDSCACMLRDHRLLWTCRIWQTRRLER
jgi:hypothetical protein